MTDKEMEQYSLQTKQECLGYAERVVELFMREQRTSHLSGPLIEGEEPDHFEILPSMYMPPGYFKGKNGLPSSLQKSPNETDEAHEKRVELYLCSLDKKQLGDVAYLINPKDKRERAFQDLLEMVISKKTTKGSCCAIF